MNIGFDLSVQEGSPAGVARVQQSLLEGLARVDRDHRYLLFARDRVTLPIDLDDRFEFVATGGPKTPRKWRARVLAAQLRDHRIDLFHSPVVSIPFRGPGKRIATAHDFPWLHPQTSAEGGAFRKVFSLGRTLRKAARVLVPSEFTKMDLVKLRPRFVDKVEVVRPGLPRKFLSEPASPQRTREVCDALGLPPPPYLLVVGTIRSRKNLDLVLRVIAKIGTLESGGARLPPTVVVGASEDRAQVLKEWARRTVSDDRVHFAGYVPEADLVPLYDGAACLLFPTLLEGFGFPPLEAFARRVPVVAAPSGAVPEVVGPSSAILVSPLDLDGWVRAVIGVISEEELREKLIRAGLKRARLFDPIDTAERVLEIYDEVVGASS